MLDGKLHTDQNGRHRSAHTRCRASWDRPCPAGAVASCVMRPIRTTESNFTYGGEGIGPECADLPCKVDQESVTATYALNAEERQAIANGAHLTLIVWAHPLPPVSLGVSDESVVESWKDYDMICTATEQCGSVWAAKRNLTHCGHCGSPLRPAMLA